MNLQLRVVIRQLGFLLFVLSAMILLVTIFAWADRRWGGSPDTTDVKAFALTSLAGLIAGTVCILAGRRMEKLFGQREALLLVAISWIAGAALSATPYRLWSVLRENNATVVHRFDSFVDCYFEAMSGLTTTGATVLDSIGTLPRSLLLWRSLTHWLGGLGIVVLFVAVLPMLGMGSRRIYRIEAPGPTPEGVKPRIQDAARILWYIYTGLTVAEILALRLFGMPWFDSVCHTFATLATGGFSTQDASIAAYPSTAIHLVIMAFMVLAGMNFALYHQLLRGDWKSVLKDPELRLYLGLMLIAAFVVTASLMIDPPAAMARSGWGVIARDASFQVVSVQTTTGFCSADFDQWNFLAKATLLVMMFVGGSAGSTGGGIKVIRVLIAVKVLLSEIEHAYRPRVVRIVKVGKSTIEADLKLNTLVYVLGIAVVFALGTIALMSLEPGGTIDITTAATATAATLNNIGPGLAKVGATQNYAWFSAPGKMVMCLLMLLGRLELFTVVVLFSPRFWKTE